MKKYLLSMICAASVVMFVACDEDNSGNEDNPVAGTNGNYCWKVTTTVLGTLPQVSYMWDTEAEVKLYVGRLQQAGLDVSYENRRQKTIMSARNLKITLVTRIKAILMISSTRRKNMSRPSLASMLIQKESLLPKVPMAVCSSFPIHRNSLAHWQCSANRSIRQASRLGMENRQSTLSQWIIITIMMVTRLHHITKIQLERL